MNQKDFNLLLNEISNRIKPINQLLFECLVLIIFYYLFNKISFIKKDSQDTNTHLSFIYLICFICILLDWFIWNNQIQTSLFTAILIVYIIFNINKSKTISTFINIVNESRDINNLNIQNENEIKNNELEQEYQKAIEQDKLNRITFIPKEIDFTIPSNNPNYSPDAYEKNLVGINELNSAYSSGIPSIHITDSQFAELQLNGLYDSTQYKNIKKMDTDKSLDNYNKYQETRNILYSPIDVPINSAQVLSQDSSPESNLDLFKNPKKEFLDNRWLDLKENTYNDNCKNCKTSGNSINNTNPSNTKYNNKNKNAICSVVKYGQELEECTNQTNTVDIKQLDKISSNKIEPIYKF